MDKPRGHQDYKSRVGSIFAEIYFAPRELYDWSATCKSRDFCATISCLGAETLKKHKAISMMRGKSPPSDVEMSKSEFRGGHLGFLAAIFDSQWVLDKPVLYIW